jgi:hypothetical protein
VGRVWIALAALIGFVAGFAATLIIGISTSISTSVESECDGVCFSELPAVGLAAFAIGVVSAILAALAASSYFAKPS